MFPEDLPIVKRLEGLLIIWTDNVNLLPRCYKYTLGTKMTQILLDMLELIVLANGDTYRRVEYLKKAMNEFELFKILVRTLDKKQLLSIKQAATLNRECSVIGKQINGWKKNTERQTQRPSDRI